jgi:hypothetical protein
MSLRHENLGGIGETSMDVDSKTMDVMPCRNGSPQLPGHGETIRTGRNRKWSEARIIAFKNNSL